MGGGGDRERRILEGGEHTRGITPTEFKGGDMTKNIDWQLINF